MADQTYINQALAAGIPQHAIDLFLAGNPGDEHRLIDALAPDYAHVNESAAAGTLTSVLAAQHEAAQPSNVANGTYPPGFNGPYLVSSSPSEGVLTGTIVNDTPPMWMWVALAAAVYLLMRR